MLKLIGLIIIVTGFCFMAVNALLGCFLVVVGLATTWEGEN